MYVVDPTTEERSEIPETPVGAIPEQLELAREAAGPWGLMPAAERAAALLPLADAL
jgi:acyl-CoA reductase-like NAD-dependent aldehyde dehydrogenase